MGFQLRAESPRDLAKPRLEFSLHVALIGVREPTGRVRDSRKGDAKILLEVPRDRLPHRLIEAKALSEHDGALAAASDIDVVAAQYVTRSL